MDVKEILRLALHPMLLAAAGGYGGKYANSKYKMKINPWLAGLGGAAIGYVVGKGIQGMLPVPATQQVQAPQPQAQAQGMTPTLDLSFGGEPAPRQLPPPQVVQPPQVQQVQQEQHAGNGSADDSGGGIFAGGFSPFDDINGDDVN